MNDANRNHDPSNIVFDSPKKATFWNRVKSLLPAMGAAVKKANNSKAKSAKYRVMYERFREILAINDSTLQFIAEIEDKLSGRAPFSIEPLLHHTRKAVLDVFRMVNNLNQIADGRYSKLYETLSGLQCDLERELSDRRQSATGRTVAPLDELRASDAAVAGRKMANLGEVKTLGFKIPDGFVITTSAFAEFMASNELWKKTKLLDNILANYNTRTLNMACRELQNAILSASIPPILNSEIWKAYQTYSGAGEFLMAMRSSAVGEDGASSHAGQYFTELNVSKELFPDSYKNVLASVYKLDAVLYRFERGLNDWETIMAVGCVRMVDPKYSGIMFSREFNDSSADRVVISATPGLSEEITGGTKIAEEIVIADGDYRGVKSSYLTGEELKNLSEAARTLEKHFGTPQDVEWAIDKNGEQYILQSRPMVMAKPVVNVIAEPETQATPLIEGGYVASPGAGSGAAFHIRKDDDLETFPKGAVVVAQRSSPTFSQIMPRAAAIVTEVGSPTGHMAILAREFNVPAIVGMKGAINALEQGRVITVDASSLKVYDGSVNLNSCAPDSCAPLANSPIVQRLRRISRLISSLNLTDPTSPTFSPSGCKSLHDITRFVHEKVYSTMFRFGDRAAKDEQNSFQLDAYLPLRILVFDVGGGIMEGAGKSGAIKPEDVVSVPMKAFMDGMLDKRIKWHRPRPVSAKGFLSVIGENMAGPPALSRGVGSASFAVISDRYMNFSTKAGYHFSTVDVYCGKSINKNYIHFRFEGGGAAPDRRLRRVKFIQEVLTSLDFRVQTQGDFLVARLDKYEHDVITSRLTQLGRLTMCARQLDMLMDNDSTPTYLAQAFLKDELYRF